MIALASSPVRPSVCTTLSLRSPTFTRDDETYTPYVLFFFSLLPLLPLPSPYLHIPSLMPTDIKPLLVSISADTFVRTSWENISAD